MSPYDRQAEKRMVTEMNAVNQQKDDFVTEWATKVYPGTLTPELIQEYHTLEDRANSASEEQLRGLS